MVVHDHRPLPCPALWRGQDARRLGLVIRAHGQKLAVRIAAEACRVDLRALACAAPRCEPRLAPAICVGINPIAILGNQLLHMIKNPVYKKRLS